MQLKSEHVSKSLEQLIYEGEKILCSGETCSILLIDEHGLLRNGSSPKLPADYLKAIDRLVPHPNVGTCSAAAATGQIVITPNFLTDEKWSELKHLPLALGYTGAFSIPIKVDNVVLGTFGAYLKEKRIPTEAEIEFFKTLSDRASVILRNQ